MKIAKYIGLWMLFQAPLLSSLVYFQVDPSLCVAIGMVYGVVSTQWLLSRYWAAK